MHLQGGLGGFFAFVAVDSTDAVNCLLFVVDGEDSEYHGDVTLGVKMCDTLGYRLAHVVEVGSAAAYHTAEYYHHIESIGLYGCRSAVCKLYGSGYTEYIYHIAAYAVFFQGSYTALGESIGYMAVPFRRNYSNADIAVDIGVERVWQIMNV